MSLYRKLMGRLLVWACEHHLVGEHCGIKLADANSNPGDDLAFVDKTKQALDLIRNHDPRRFARVQLYIDCIVNSEIYSSGQYCPGNVCKVDFGRLDFARQPDWSLYMYAATIIHEATHGYLRARGFKRTKHNWQRIEHICRDEENRFLSRINSPWGSQLQKPFDANAWNFGSRFTRARKVLSRMRQEKRKSQTLPAP